MGNPLVSIIVPIYNVEKYLEQCIDSLENQTYREIEIILVDDGSKDNSGAICDVYAKSDSRVKVIHKPNGGLSSSREAGINAALGEYIMIVDGDDWIDTDTIQECINCIIKEADLQCVLFSYIKEYPNKSIPVKVLENSQLFIGDKAEDKIYRRLFGLSNSELNHPERMHNIESCCMKLYSRELAQNGRYFGTDLVGSSEDALFNMYALYGLKKACYLDKHFYHYRKLPESITNSFRPRLVEQWSNLFNIMNEIIKERELGNRYEDALKNRIALSIFGIGINELGNRQNNFYKHIKNIKEYIKSPRYVEAVKQLEISRMPIAWQVFLWACRWKISVLVYLILYAMLYLKKKV